MHHSRERTIFPTISSGARTRAVANRRQQQELM